MIAFLMGLFVGASGGALMMAVVTVGSRADAERDDALERARRAGL